MFKSVRLSQSRIGEVLVLLSVLFSSLLFVLANPNSTALGPTWIAAFSTMLALIPFSILMIKNNLWHQLKNAKGLKYSIRAGLIIGLVYYSLIHWGSYHSSPQNAAILSCFEAFAAMLLLHKKSNEKLSSREFYGAGLLLLAIAVIFLPSSSHPALGDIILLIAGFVSPFGNWYMKQARSYISSVTIMWIRSLVGSLSLLVVSLFFSSFPSASQLTEAAPVLLINGILILGISKLFWIEGIYRIAIAKACSLAALGPILTFIFAWIILSKLPNLYQMIALPPAILGMYLIMYKSKVTN